MGKIIQTSGYLFLVIGAIAVLVYSFYFIMNPQTQISTSSPLPSLDHEPLVEITAITDPTCWACSVKEVINVTQNFFLNNSVTILNATDEKALRLLNETKTLMLPAVIITKSAEKSSSFSVAKNNFEWKNGYYVLKPDEARAVYYAKQPSTAKYPSRGPEDAPITMTVFGDFECPFTKKILPSLEKIVAQYPGKIQWTYHTFPLRPHSKAAGLAAECAHEQNRFWEYHDILFKNQNSLSSDDLKEYALHLRLNTTQFNACMDTQKYQANVQQAYQEALDLNLKGTPTVFINHIMIRGEHPFENYQLVVEQELKKIEGERIK